MYQGHNMPYYNWRYQYFHSLNCSCGSYLWVVALCRFRLYCQISEILTVSKALAIQPTFTWWHQPKNRIT